MEDKIQVTLTGPAKIGDVWHKAGDTPVVDSETLKQLHEAGAVSSTVGDPVENVTAAAPSGATFTEAEVDTIVQAAISAAMTLAVAEKDAAMAGAAAKQDLIEALEGELQLVKTALVDAGQSHDAALAEARKTISDQEALIARLQKASAKTKADPPPRGT
jgi:hypothetical protein